jgi:hypothetical protein|tara:strand:- start:836 stop:1009 length:174 start_codon:yes stop_codon:yes gene_type:complete
MALKTKDKSTWAIGGGVIMGTGVGLFFSGFCTRVRGVNLNWPRHWFADYSNHLNHER